MFVLTQIHIPKIMGNSLAALFVVHFYTYSVAPLSGNTNKIKRFLKNPGTTT